MLYDFKRDSVVAAVGELIKTARTIIAESGKPVSHRELRSFTPLNTYDIEELERKGFLHPVNQFGAKISTRDLASNKYYRYEEVAQYGISVTMANSIDKIENELNRIRSQVCTLIPKKEAARLIKKSVATITKWEGEGKLAAMNKFGEPHDPIADKGKNRYYHFASLMAAIGDSK